MLSMIVMMKLLILKQPIGQLKKPLLNLIKLLMSVDQNIMRRKPQFQRNTDRKFVPGKRKIEGVDKFKRIF